MFGVLPGGENEREHRISGLHSRREAQQGIRRSRDMCCYASLSVGWGREGGGEGEGRGRGEGREVTQKGPRGRKPQRTATSDNNNNNEKQLQRGLQGKSDERNSEPGGDTDPGQIHVGHGLL